MKRMILTVGLIWAVTLAIPGAGALAQQQDSAQKPTPSCCSPPEASPQQATAAQPQKGCCAKATRGGRKGGCCAKRFTQKTTTQTESKTSAGQ